MAENGKAREMFLLGMESFRSNGRLELEELDRIIALGLEDGILDPAERSILIDIISSMSSKDLTPEVWLRVEQIVQVFQLDGPV
jgi:hypothetical protein